MGKVAGTAFFKVDGVQYNLRGSVTVALGQKSRESVVGMDKFHGIKEIPAIPFIEVELTDQPEIDLNALQDLSDVTVQVELITGKLAILRNANQVNDLELNVDEGTVTVRFEGPEGEWLTNDA